MVQSRDDPQFVVKHRVHVQVEDAPGTPKPSVSDVVEMEKQAEVFFYREDNLRDAFSLRCICRK
jgi:hypothetical protein